MALAFLTNIKLGKGKRYSLFSGVSVMKKFFYNIVINCFFISNSLDKLARI